MSHKFYPNPSYERWNKSELMQYISIWRICARVLWAATRNKNTSQADVFLKYRTVQIYIIKQQGRYFAVSFLTRSLNEMRDRKCCGSFVSYVYFSALKDKLLLLDQGGRKISLSNLFCEKRVKWKFTIAWFGYAIYDIFSRHSAPNVETCTVLHQLSKF